MHGLPKYPELQEYIDTLIKKKENGETISNDEYYNIKDPWTGCRYDIPMLSTGSPNYREEYIGVIKRLIWTPDMFERIVNWD